MNEKKETSNEYQPKSKMLGKRKRYEDNSENSNHLELETLSQSTASDKKLVETCSPTDSLKRKTMEIMKCPHKHQKHYAKGMCNHCYHKYGRNSYATECAHTDRLVYAKGKCQNCYLNDYNKQKRRQKKEKGLKSVSPASSEIDLPALEKPTKRGNN